jgi:hypothetical protein
VPAAVAGNAHRCRHALFTTSGNALTVSCKEAEAGLGDEAQVEITTSADALCINNGRNHPKAMNKTDISQAFNEPGQNGKAELSRLSAYLGMMRAASCGGDLGGSDSGVRPMPILARVVLRRRLSSRGGGRRLIPKWSRRLRAGSGGKRSASRPVLSGQVVASSNSRRVWKARLPILRATVSRATVVSRRWRVAR